MSDKRLNRLKRKYKLFNFKRLGATKKYVSGVLKPWWKRTKSKKHQFSEKTLEDVLKIFMPEYKNVIFTQKKLPNSDFYRITPDYRIEIEGATAFNLKNNSTEAIKGIIFEYDGDKHFQSALQMNADKRKMKEICNHGYRRIRIPFYYQLTEDLGKFIFNGLMYHYTGKTFFTKQKWKEAVKKIYLHPVFEKKINDKDFLSNFPIIGAPGMHATEYVPSSFNEKGLRIFVKDLFWQSKRPYQHSKCHPDAKFPVSARQQIVKTLELYINDTNDGKGGKPHELILPSKKTIYGRNLSNIFYKVKSSYKKEYLNKVFYGRKQYKNEFPELYYS